MNKDGYPFVSVVVPAYNEEKHIGKCLEGIHNQDYPKEKIEINVINDGSTDNTLKIVENYKEKCDNLRVLTQKNSGAAIATNKGIQNSKGDIICLIDSDAIIERDWLKKIIKEFEDPKVGAVGSNILTCNPKNILARVMGYDSEYRYWRLKSKYINHVDTCATGYRREVFEKVGLFDPKFKYGYDVDMSYRLVKKEYKLIFLKNAKVWHYWKDTLKGYLKQQFNVSYGRLHVIKKHPDKGLGDEVVNVREIIQLPVTGSILLSAIFSIIIEPLLWISIGILFLLVMERSFESITIYRKKRDFMCLITLPLVHILRNIVWCIALVKFGIDNIRNHLMQIIVGEK